MEHSFCRCTECKVENNISINYYRAAIKRKPKTYNVNMLKLYINYNQPDCSNNGKAVGKYTTIDSQVAEVVEVSALENSDADTGGRS